MKENRGSMKKNPKAGQPVPGYDFNHSDYKGGCLITEPGEYWIDGYWNPPQGDNEGFVGLTFKKKKPRVASPQPQPTQPLPGFNTTPISEDKIPF